MKGHPAGDTISPGARGFALHEPIGVTPLFPIQPLSGLEIKWALEQEVHIILPVDESPPLRNTFWTLNFDLR